MKKLYHAHQQHAATMLHAILVEGKQSEDVVRKMTAIHKEWGSNDRKTILNLLYGVLRNKLLYEYLLEKSGEEITLEKQVAIQAWKDQMIVQEHQLSSEVIQHIQEILNDKIPEHIRVSVPEWLYPLNKENTFEEWHSMLKPADTCIRVNTLITTKDKVCKKLDELSVNYTLLPGDAIRIHQKVQLTKWEIYQKGWFEIQDESSQQVAPFMELKDGMNILDGCCGAGGKSLHIAALLNNKGNIWSTDIHSHKIEQLKIRAQRAKATCIQALVITDEFISNHTNTFDQILLDVPCSSLGTLRRKPEIKYSITPESLQSIVKTQQDILHRYSVMLKKGGRLIYSTCSILPMENEENMAAFLKLHSDFKLEKSRRISPTHGSDGFFMASMIKL
jgi:16S rRNA (cytosine967-C5)-methyltransferase